MADIPRLQGRIQAMIFKAQLESESLTLTLTLTPTPTLTLITAPEQAQLESEMDGLLVKQACSM